MSSRNALSHGAYASDDTLLAVHSAPHPGSASRGPAGCLVHDAKQTHTVPGDDPQSAPADLPVAGDGPALLESFSTHYNPDGPAETLLVRRIVAATLRIDLLERSLDALMELGERRALIDHLVERFALNEPKMQVRDAPSYASMLRRYDGTAELPTDFDPALDPDPALCTLAYTLSGSRAALLMRHEATAERRLHAAMRALHRLQADRRKQDKERNEPTTLRANPPAQMHAAFVENEPIPSPLPSTPSSTARNEPNSPTPTPPIIATRAARNEPIPAPPARQSTAPVSSHAEARPSWDRNYILSSDILERLIRDAGRRVASPNQHQPGPGPQSSDPHARRGNR